jgi:hypothetical protein
MGCSTSNPPAETSRWQAEARPKKSGRTLLEDGHAGIWRISSVGSKEAPSPGNTERESAQVRLHVDTRIRSLPGKSLADDSGEIYDAGDYGSVVGMRGRDDADCMIQILWDRTRRTSYLESKRFQHYFTVVQETSSRRESRQNSEMVCAKSVGEPKGKTADELRVDYERVSNANANSKSSQKNFKALGYVAK